MRVLHFIWTSKVPTGSYVTVYTVILAQKRVYCCSGEFQRRCGNLMTRSRGCYRDKADKRTSTKQEDAGHNNRKPEW